MYPVRCLPQRMSFRRHFMERDPPKRKSGASPKERNKSMKKILNVEEMKNMNENRKNLDFKLYCDPSGRPYRLQ